MKRMPLTLAIWVMGLTFIIAQILAVREFLVVFQGNELYIGIVLGNWLLLEAAGSAIGGKISDRSKHPVRILAFLQMVVSILLPVTILAIRMSRDLVGIPPWETIGPIRVWIASLVILGPVGACLGVEFSFACRLFSQVLGEKSRAAGTVYVLEAIGSVCGGIIFTYLFVGHLNAIRTALVIGSLNSLSSLIVLGRSWPAVKQAPAESVNEEGFPKRSSPGLRIQRCLCLVILSVAALLLVTPLADDVEQSSSRMRWKGLDLMGSADSVYGNISVFKMGDQFSFFQNGIPAITTPIPDITSVEEVVHLSLLCHESPKTVLFMGGGLGGALAEALKHPIKDLYYTELDPLVIKMVQKFSTPMTNQELGDQRTHMQYQDGRRFLLKSDLLFDAVLVNLPDVTTLLLNRVFTMEFFSAIKRHLNPDGLLALTLPGSSSYLSEELLLLNQCVLTTLRCVFPHTRIIPGERNLLLASERIPLESLTPEVLSARMLRDGIKAAVMSPWYIKLKLDPVKARWLTESLERARHARINQDLSPSLLYYFLAYKNAQLHNRWRAAVGALDRIRAWHLLLALLALNIPILIWRYVKKMDRAMALSFSIFTTGLAGMTMEIILILSFQTLYGYIYHWVGILVSSFMGGLALGAFLINRRLEQMKHGYTVFVLLEIALIIIILAVALAVSIPARIHLEGTVAFGLMQIVFVCMCSMSGFVVGAEFPLANIEYLRQHKGVSRIAGRLYAMDLGGACIGTMLASVLFVPLIGIPQTLFLTATLKAMGILYLILAR